MHTPILRLFMNYYCNFLKWTRHFLLILRYELQGVKNTDENVSKKNIVIHCFENNDIKYIFTLQAILNKAFLTKLYWLRHVAAALGPESVFNLTKP